jgi:protein-L-isoaspartate(D-aspartate) O-methyltransferase
MEYDNEQKFRKLRDEMVLRQLIQRQIKAPRVLEAMRKVPRHLFVQEGWEERAYEDRALPLGMQQTISQPYIVAQMLQAADLKASDTVLDIGSGSGYTLALLSRLVKRAIGIELDPVLAMRSRRCLEQLRLDNVSVLVADGHAGCLEQAPFDAIFVAAACQSIPRDLVKQLRDGGRLILPLGIPEEQELICITKRGDALETRELGAVRFVPLLDVEE